MSKEVQSNPGKSEVLHLHSDKTKKKQQLCVLKQLESMFLVWNEVSVTSISFERMKKSYDCLFVSICWLLREFQAQPHVQNIGSLIAH